MHTDVCECTMMELIMLNVENRKTIKLICGDPQGNVDLFILINMYLWCMNIDDQQ